MVPINLYTLYFFFKKLIEDEIKTIIKTFLMNLSKIKKDPYKKSVFFMLYNKRN